ncbi:MAG: cytosine permease [Lachnospiraceae bacterium]|nr:cytosine permease [Lachnospiraceae bacterium]
MNDVEKSIQQEVYFGTYPVLPKERKYGFIDALLVLSGYCIATWSYTQGSYLATLVNFKQLLIGAFAAALFMLLIYQLPVILSVRYGIDIWIWLRSVFGFKGVNLVTVLIILVNFPWYAVCCELFADSMENLLKIFGIPLFPGGHLVLSISCVVIGTFIAYKGIGSITWTTRILVPLLLLVGMVVVVVGMTSVPLDVIWNYRPELSGDADSTINYILSIEANFAFVITLVGGMAEVPRICKSERSGFYAGVLGQGLAGSFFVVVGAVMAIAMRHVTGQMIDDPTLMLATLSAPILGLSSLLLVAFANIGTQAVGSYIYGVMLKTTFPKISYRVLILILGAYVTLLCIWGKITEYFGSFLTVGACVYAPLAALLFVDFFLVRKQKLDLKSAFGLKGHHSYDYTRGYNLVGLICLVFGFALSLLIYDPIKGIVHIHVLFVLTPTGCSFLATGILYYLLCKLAPVRRYVRKDACVIPDKKPFDRKKVPPKQNLFLFPFILLACKVITSANKLKIDKHNMEGIKPPFLVLGTHQSFTDFYVTPLCLAPYRANYISELEGFELYGEWIYRQIGCLGTRKFITDHALVSNIRKVIGRKGIMVIYPEARYANVGTSSQLPMSVAKLVRLLKVPVVTLNMQGNYLLSPIWNLKTRKSVKLHADVTCAITKEQAETLSAEEIYKILSGHLEFDEYRYQRENKMVIADDFRAEGLHMPLYQCICCKKEFTTETKGAVIRCRSCGASYEMDEFGTLHKAGSDETLYIPDWYEWQREQVKKQIDADSYELDMKVQVDALPNAFNFVDCGKGRLVHNKNGFDLTLYNYRTDQTETLHFSPKSCFSIHTEYDYRGKGQCVTLSTMDDTFFIYPLEEGFNATKIQFATEYMAAPSLQLGKP